MSVSGQPRLNAVLSGGSAVLSAGATLTSANTWYQLVASTTTPVYIISMSFYNGATDTTADIGTGAAASETVVASVLSAVASARAERVTFPYPIRVPAGARIAIRSTTGGGYTASITYAIEPKVG